jgi:hypothetical protein
VQPILEYAVEAWAGIQIDHVTPIKENNIVISVCYSSFSIGMTRRGSLLKFTSIAKLGQTNTAVFGENHCNAIPMWVYGWIFG